MGLLLVWIELTIIITIRVIVVIIHFPSLLLGFTLFFFFIEKVLALSLSNLIDLTAYEAGKNFFGDCMFDWLA